ncbi:MAG: hypothetical protein RTU30_10235, partial [Candidatus Thorarchaeota archaeon]
FGYDFVFPLGQFSRLTLRVDQIPQIWSEESPSFMNLEIRKSKSSDIGDLERLYDDLGNRLLVRHKRSQEMWNLQENLKKWRAFDFNTEVVVNDGNVVGYLRYIIHDESSPMIQVWGSPAIDVIESSINNYDGVMRTIYYLKEIAREQNLSLIFLPITPASNLSRIVSDIGGQTELTWRHQIRVPNMVYLLNTVAPAIEKHLEDTMFSSLSQELRINTYRNCYLLNFEDGVLTLVKELGPQPWGDLSIRYHDLIRLVFGERTFDELREMNSDAMVSGDLKSLIATLFPKGESFIHYYQC